MDLAALDTVFEACPSAADDESKEPGGFETLPVPKGPAFRQHFARILVVSALMAYGAALVKRDEGGSGRTCFNGAVGGIPKGKERKWSTSRLALSQALGLVLVLSNIAAGACGADVWQVSQEEACSAMLWAVQGRRKGQINAAHRRKRRKRWRVA